MALFFPVMESGCAAENCELRRHLLGPAPLRIDEPIQSARCGNATAPAFAEPVPSAVTRTLRPRSGPYPCRVLAPYEADHMTATSRERSAGFIGEPAITNERPRLTIRVYL